MAPTLVVQFTTPGKYAFNVLLGALEGEELRGGFEVVVAARPGELVSATERAVRSGEPVVVAWSSYSTSFAKSVAELGELRAVVPHGWLSVIGGVHATAEPLACLRAGFDRVAIGEGESIVVELARALRERRSIDDVAGLARAENGALVTRAKAPIVADLDTYPAFAARRRRFGAIEITRGCVFACKFCQTPFVSRARFRHRTPANVAHWAGELARAGLRDVRFVSPTSLSYGALDDGVDLAAVEELLARVREAIGPQRRLFFGTFPSEVRPEHVTAPALELLARHVDNDNLVIGGQSGSERVLRHSHRGHDVAAIERAVATCKEHGFKANVDFLLGLPGEEDEDIAATLELVERLARMGAKAHAHTFMPLPGTPFRDQAPGRISATTRERLERLEGSGLVYGQWRSQLQLADTLARERDTDRAAQPRGRRAPSRA